MLRRIQLTGDGMGTRQDYRTSQIRPGLVLVISGDVVMDSSDLQRFGQLKSREANLRGWGCSREKRKDRLGFEARPGRLGPLGSASSESGGCQCQQTRS